LREPFSDGLYAEAGASRIPETHDLTLKYVKLFGLTLDPFYPSGGATLYSVRGKRIKLRPGETLDLAQLPFGLTPEERRLGLDALEAKYIDPVLKELGNPAAPGWPPERLRKYDQITWPEFLRSVGAVSLEAGSSRTHSAERMICAIPFSCLRRVEVSPRFRPEKHAVIDQLYYDPVVRVFLQMRRRFWTDEGLNGFADTDHPMEIWHPTFDQPGIRGILMAYLEDGLTRRVAAMPESERIRFGIEAVERAHPRLRVHLEAATSLCWGEQPWARGAYSAFRPGEI